MSCVVSTSDCRFTLKHVRDMIRTYNQMHHTDKYSQQSSITWRVWLNSWVFVYKLRGCGFESRCSHLNFRYCACFEQVVPWYSDNYRVQIYAKTCAWHKNKQHEDVNVSTKIIVGRFTFRTIVKFEKFQKIRNSKGVLIIKEKFLNFIRPSPSFFPD